MSSDDSEPPSPRNYKRKPRSRSPSPREYKNFENGDSPREEEVPARGGGGGESYANEEHGRTSLSHSPNRRRSGSHDQSHKKHKKRTKSHSRSPKRKRKHHSEEKRRSRSRSYSHSPPRSHERRHRRSNSPRPDRRGYSPNRRGYSPDRRGYGRPRYGGGGGGGGGGRGYRNDRGHKPRPLNVPENKVIGVFGMSMYTTEKNIEDYFKRYGRIEKVHVIVDRQTGNSRGFAFVYFEDINDAIDAKESCDGLELDGRKIRVDYSLTKEPHSPTPGAYMGRRSRRDDDYDRRR